MNILDSQGFMSPKFEQPALDSEYIKYAQNTEFVATVGKLR